MSPRIKYLAGPALALSLVAVIAVLGDSTKSADSTTPTLSGVAAGMHFTDEQGNARIPSAAERAALAAAFQQDLADLTRGKRLPVGTESVRGGAISAVVGIDKMRLLTVEVDENGEATFGHASMDETGSVDIDTPDNDWPEM